MFASLFAEKSVTSEWLCPWLSGFNSYSYTDVDMDYTVDDLAEMTCYEVVEWLKSVKFGHEDVFEAIEGSYSW